MRACRSASASAALFVTAVSACQTAREHVDVGSHVRHVDLRPTVGGRELLGNEVVPGASPPSESRAHAGVTWNAAPDGGGSVLFFGDSTVCVRRERQLGFEIDGAKYDASTDVGANLIHVDLLGAEARALEAGLDLARVTPWLLIGDVSVGRPQAAEEAAVHAAKQIVASGFANLVYIATLHGDSTPEMRLVLLPPDGSAFITDRMDATVVGPRITALPGDLRQLLDGPETSQRASHGLVVTIWVAGDNRVWTAPGVHRTANDERWLVALEHVLSAIERGCTFPY